jgi:hypothetical protein
VALRRKQQQHGTEEASAALLLQCHDQAYCAVIFEPYGSEYQLLSGDDWLRVQVGGAAGGEVEVVRRPNSIVLWPSKGLDYLEAVNRAGDRPTGLF